MGKSDSKVKSKNWVQKAKVRAKLLAPVGIRLNSGDVAVLEELYKEDVKTLQKNELEVESAIAHSETLDIEDSIKEAVELRGRAVGTYKQTKNPVKKREWARRMVVANETVQNLRKTKQRMSATKDRLEMVLGDIKIQLLDAQARAQEAEAYAKAGESMRLVGEKLIDARTRAKSRKVEYENLEVTMENAERMVAEGHDNVVAEADSLVIQFDAETTTK